MAKNNSKKDIVINNADNIKEWLAQGMSIQSIANALHISKSTLYKYMTVDGLDDIKKERQPAVENLENTMYMSACGFERKVKKCTKVRRCIYNENGKKAEEWEEMVEYEETVYYPPDTTAAIFLLKNWAKYMNEPATVDLRKREIELKEAQAW